VMASCLSIENQLVDLQVNKYVGAAINQSINMIK